jgi:hydrogenase maturation protease
MWNLCKPLKPGLDWQIVGIGSYLNSDDEIGLALVHALSEKSDWASHCILWEGADAATIASALLEWCRPTVLVDAANMDLPPGDYRFFPDQDATVTIKDSSVSTHGLGLAEGLQLARNLGFEQPVRIFAVQPFDLSPKQGLTPEMAAGFPALLSALQKACKDVAGIA